MLALFGNRTVLAEFLVTTADQCTKLPRYTLTGAKNVLKNPKHSDKNKNND